MVARTVMSITISVGFSAIDEGIAFRKRINSSVFLQNRTLYSKTKTTQILLPPGGPSENVLLCVKVKT